MKYLRTRFSLILTVVFLVGCFGVAEFATAEDCLGFKVDGSARWRAEADGRDFNGDTDMSKCSVLRTRLGFNLSCGDVSSYVQVQYPYGIGWDSSDLAISEGLDVHQAFLNIDEFLMESLALKIGRTELSYGDERLIGAVGWDNVGRTFDGFVLTFDSEAISVDAFMTKQLERQPANPGNAPDDHFSGLWAVYKPLKLNVFALFSAKADANTYGDIETNNTLNTFGFHYKNHYASGLGVLLDYAMQMGTMTTFGTPDVETDLSGMLVVLALSYTVDNPMKPMIKVGIDMASGDDPETAEENEAFNDLYYTGHKWRGNMDYFTVAPEGGLTDIFVKLSAQPMPGTSLGLAFHNFATGQDYASVVDGEKVTAIGNELDIDLKMDLKNNLMLGAGMGMFMAAEEWVGADKDNGMWYYLSLTSMFNAGR